MEGVASTEAAFLALIIRAIVECMIITRLQYSLSFTLRGDIVGLLPINSQFQCSNKDFLYLLPIVSFFLKKYVNSQF